VWTFPRVIYYSLGGHSSKTSDQKGTFWNLGPPLVQHRPFGRYPPLRPVHERPDCIARKGPKCTQFCNPDVCERGWGGVVVSYSDTYSERKSFCTCGHSVYVRPLPRSAVIRIDLPPPLMRANALKGGGGGGQYSKNTKIWKRCWCMTPPNSSYGGAALDFTLQFAIRPIRQVIGILDLILSTDLRVQYNDTTSCLVNRQQSTTGS